MARENGSFFFEVENSKDQAERSTEPKGGIGLANVKRRLELLYPARHLLQIKDENSTFKVQLELALPEREE